MNGELWLRFPSGRDIDALGLSAAEIVAAVEENKQAMISAGVPEQIAQMNARAFSLTADGDAEWVTEDVPSLLGRPARTVVLGPPAAGGVMGSTSGWH